MSEPSPEKSGSKQSREAACPICKKVSVAQFRPFCSKRCADLDLGRWLNGAYAIAAVEDDNDGEDDSTSELSHQS
ncbi:MAG: DNA gyrase inhibitor YacG [Alphaproteobacteria bacterium]|nr:DNA gyrase inhibitor YacG [Alphaproteobacteria bacterium]MDE2494009.1 DNA gyrase inhibitor YacG [Alphaproteobacteria bacterium]